MRMGVEMLEVGRERSHEIVIWGWGQEQTREMSNSFLCHEKPVCMFSLGRSAVFFIYSYI